MNTQKLKQKKGSFFFELFMGDGDSNGGAMANNSMAELFGPPRRRPLLSNTLRSLSRIYSLFPEENPFSQFADCTHTPAVWQACNVPQKSLVKPTTGAVGENSDSRNEVNDIPIHNGVNQDGNAEVLCEENGFDRSEMVIDELNGGKESETVDKAASNEKDTNDHMAEAHTLSLGLLGIETILMDESDGMDILQMSNKDVNFDILKDFGTFAISDGLGNDSVPVVSNGNDKVLVEGNLKENVVVENKGKDMEAKKSTSRDNSGQSHDHVPMEREKGGCSEVGNQLVGSTSQDVGRKEPKVYRRKTRQDISETGGLIFSAQRSKNEGETISGAKGADSVEKGRKSGAVDKKKTKKSKKAALKDVKSGKSKRVSLDGEGSNRTKSGGGDSAVIGKTQKLNVHGNQGNLSVKLVGKCGPPTCENLQYTRDQLMHLREPAAVPPDILKAVKEISAQLHGGKQNPTVEEGMETSVSNKGQLCTSTADEDAGEMVSDIMKKKKRGSSSETRKEKKKQKRRKKRAEMNKKLGVKRLKLKPILKPKVVSHCRHYLKGRCQEGEKCKFSHDVIPLTKSKPCCHFARHSCMKGDDCPYDHQLSKYPCNNVVETGFCSRGDSCLFSHKISAKEGSEAKVGVSKNETCSLDQLGKSKNSTKQLSAANVPSSGITTMPKNLKENLAAQISNKPTKAPKGLSFLSFGTPSLDDNSAQSQPSVDFARTNGQPHPGNTSMSMPVSPTPQRVGFLSAERSSVDKAGQPNPTVSPSQRAVDLNRTLVSFPHSPTSPAVGVHPLQRTSVDSSTGTSSGQPNPIAQGRAAQLGTTLMGPPTPQGVEFLSPQKAPNQASPSPFGSDLHKLQGGLVSTNGHTGSQIENRSVSEPDKSKGVNSEPRWASLSGPGKSTPGTGQRALLSTLAFAAKFQSGIKMSSAGSTEVKKNEGASGSGSKQKEPMKASAILELLYGGSKERQ